MGAGERARRTSVTSGVVARLRPVRARVAPRGSARGWLIDRIAGARRPPTMPARSRSDPRILVAGPPKPGNMWIKCVLAHVCGLRCLEPRDELDGAGLEALRAFVARGGFAPGTIVHRHYRPSPELSEIARGV